MKLTLTLALDTKAFGRSPRDRAEEVNEIILKWIDKLDAVHANTTTKLHDSNGNHVGDINVEP